MDASLAPAWPNLAKAAQIVGVHQATLQRSKLDLPVLAAGGKEKLVAPVGVLAAALYFRRRPLREVAADVIAVAEDKCPELVAAISSEVDEFLDAHSSAPLGSAEDLLHELRQALPAGLGRRIEATYRRGAPAASAAKGRSPRTATGGTSRRRSKVPA